MPSGADGPDPTRLADWLDAALPGHRTGPLRASPITGGRSNLTYRIDDDVRSWALRRPPHGDVGAAAHDMAREHRVITGLSGSAVPVPTPVALCADPAVLGAPFYLMDFVDGAVLTDPDQAGDAAAGVGELLVDTLVALHGTDPAAAGLADLGRPEGFRERQVGVWHRVFLAGRPGGDPDVEEVVRRLRRGVPRTGPVGIVHGDYRLTNLMYAPDLRSVAAVVDWELATVGDPLTDVGMLVAYHQIAPRAPEIMPDFGPAHGYLGPGQLLDRYVTGSGGVGGAGVDWYVGLAYLKIAALGAMLQARHRRAGATGTAGGANADVTDRLIRLPLEAALDTTQPHVPA